MRSDEKKPADGQLRRRAEARLGQEHPEQPPLEGPDAQRLLHELEVHQIELEMQNSELRRSREELEQLLEQYTDLYDFAPVGYFTLNDEGIIRAVNLAGALNAGSTTVNSLRASADANMTTEVGQLNDLLGQFGAANATIVAGLKSGADVTDAMDTRDSLLTRISGIVGTSTTTDANGSMSIYTDSGVTLFQNQPRVVSMAPTATLSSGVNGAPVIADGVPPSPDSSRSTARPRSRTRWRRRD